VLVTVVDDLLPLRHATTPTLSLQPEGDGESFRHWLNQEEPVGEFPMYVAARAVALTGTSGTGGSGSIRTESLQSSVRHRRRSNTSHVRRGRSSHGCQPNRRKCCWRPRSSRTMSLRKRYLNCGATMADSARRSAESDDVNVVAQEWIAVKAAHRGRHALAASPHQTLDRASRNACSTAQRGRCL
jgi:hypothetical protein